MFHRGQFSYFIWSVFTSVAVSPEYHFTPSTASLTWSCCGRWHCETHRWRWPHPQPGWRLAQRDSLCWWGLETENVTCWSYSSYILTRHEEAEPGDRLQGLVVVVRPALDQRALTHNVSSDVRETRTDLVTPADVSHLQIIDGLAVHLK